MIITLFKIGQSSILHCFSSAARKEKRRNLYKSHPKLALRDEVSQIICDVEVASTCESVTGSSGPGRNSLEDCTKKNVTYVNPEVVDAA